MNVQKKNKVILSDYNYRRDIEVRLLLADLSSFEVDLLREILDNSLKIPLKHFAELLDIPESKLTPFIEKFTPTKLIKVEGSTLLVDKEMRKYYESQIMKFDEDFEPGMEFLQSILNKIPIQFIPQWYAISRTSDHFFQSIVDRFLSSPKIYERYLQELHFDHDVLYSIIEDVFTAPDFKVSGKSIIKKYKLTPEQFEEFVLLLEYNFACCLGYQKVDDRWEEMITPFHEWGEYLRFRRDNTPKPITDISKIIVKHPQEEFGFVHDMSNLLKLALKKSVPIDSKEETFLSHKAPPAYVESILQKIQFLHLGEIRDNKLYVHDIAHDWLKKPVQDRALSFSRHPIKVEKSLKRVLESGWIYVEDFINGFTGAINGKGPVALQQKGKRWKYVLPTYTEEEKILIETTLCERLFEAGLVAVGTHANRPCFKVTAFGRIALED